MRVFPGACLLLLCASGSSAQTAAPYATEVVSLPSGALRLRALVGRRASDVMRGAEEEAGDVVAALEYLQTLPSVDPERISVGGVSLGGLVSIMAASREARFKAVISMAGGYRQGGQGGVDEAWPLVQGVWKNGAQKIRAPVLILWSKNDMII